VWREGREWGEEGYKEMKVFNGEQKVVGKVGVGMLEKGRDVEIRGG
jgi:hypothetical protein